MNRQEPVIVALNMEALVKKSGILSFVLLFLFVAANGLIHQRWTFDFSLLNILYFFIGYFLLIVLHETFHLIGFMLFGQVKYRELDYGVNLKLGIAYATTTKPLSNAAMKKALLLPFWTTGALPAIIGLFTDNFLFVALGALLIAGAAGDFQMYKELRKFPDDAIVKDDPKEPKLYVYTKH